MALYKNVSEMIHDIRSHVAEHGHQVVVSDSLDFKTLQRPAGFERVLGYACAGCLKGVTPQVWTWHVGVRGIEDLETAMLYGEPLHGLKDGVGRDRLTAYLNGELEKILNVSSGPVVNRYHRPWVI